MSMFVLSVNQIVKNILRDHLMMKHVYFPRKSQISICLSYSRQGSMLSPIEKLVKLVTVKHLRRRHRHYLLVCQVTVKYIYNPLRVCFILLPLSGRLCRHRFSVALSIWDYGYRITVIFLVHVYVCVLVSKI